MALCLYQCCRHSSLINTQKNPLLNNIFFKMEQFHYSQPQEIQTPDSDTIKFQYQPSKLLRLKKKKGDLRFLVWLNQCSFASPTSVLFSSCLTGVVSTCSSWLGQAVFTISPAHHPHLFQHKIQPHNNGCLPDLFLL